MKKFTKELIKSAELVNAFPETIKREFADFIKINSLLILEPDVFEQIYGQKPVQLFLDQAKEQLLKSSNERIFQMCLMIIKELELNKVPYEELILSVLPKFVFMFYTVEYNNAHPELWEKVKKMNKNFCKGSKKNNVHMIWT